MLTQQWLSYTSDGQNVILLLLMKMGEHAYDNRDEYAIS